MDNMQEIQWEEERHAPGSLIVFDVTPDIEQALMDERLIITRDRRWLCAIVLPCSLSSGIIHGTVD